MMVQMYLLCFNSLILMAVSQYMGYQKITADLIYRLNNLQPGELAEELSGQVEGDIILTEDQRITYNGKADEIYRWPNRTVPILFADEVNDEQRSAIWSAIDDIEKFSCVRFVERTTELDYIYIQTSEPGCFSYVGRIIGPQALNLMPFPIGKGCYKHGTIIHEFLHALGFKHMHSASYRDEHVLILWENIKENKLRNFLKSKSLTTSFGELYDFDSILHYTAKAFSSNKGYTIVPIDDKISPKRLGQRVGMSILDIRKLRAMYKCN